MNYRAKEILSFILLITGIIVSVLEIIGVIDLNILGWFWKRLGNIIV